MEFLKKLTDLLQAGIITQTEFDEKKAKLLSKRNTYEIRCIRFRNRQRFF